MITLLLLFLLQNLWGRLSIKMELSMLVVVGK